MHSSHLCRPVGPCLVTLTLERAPGNTSNMRGVGNITNRNFALTSLRSIREPLLVALLSLQSVILAACGSEAV